MKKKRLSSRVIKYVMSRSPSEISTLTVKGISGHFNVTSPHLSRTFRDDTGINLKKFIVREKMLRMRSVLLRNRKTPIKDIARQYHFCSSDYFITLFREHSGMTPMQFRKLNKTIHVPAERRKGVPDRRSSTEGAAVERRTHPADRRQG